LGGVHREALLAVGGNQDCLAAIGTIDVLADQRAVPDSKRGRAVRALKPGRMHFLESLFR
jgi:hypothetical protein